MNGVKPRCCTIKRMILTAILLLNASLPEGAGSSLFSNDPYRDPVTGMEFLFVEGGCFEMGDTHGEGYFAEKPVHLVCIDNFYIGKHEVTHAEWRTIMGDQLPYSAGIDNLPTSGVNHEDILSFMTKFSQITGKKFRLPTEAEWEYACRSRGLKERFSGFNNTNNIFRYANFCDVNCTYEWMTGEQNDGHKDAAPVGSYRPNGLGLYDMSGNVWEWVADWFDEDYYKKSPKDNPRGPQSGRDKVVRGGCWLNSPNYLRCSYRFGLNYLFRENDIGFRVVMEK